MNNKKRFLLRILCNLNLLYALFLIVKVVLAPFPFHFMSAICYSIVSVLIFSQAMHTKYLLDKDQ